MPETASLFERTMDAWKAGDDEFVDNALFAFERSDDYYVYRVSVVIRGLLQRPDLTPQEIVAIGRTLHGLNRLPLRTPGLDVQISLVIKGPDSADSYNLYFSADHFETCSGGYANFGFGSDAFSGSTIEVENHARNWDPYHEHWPDIFSEMTGAMLEIIDDSNDQMMEWEHPDGSTFWEWINQHD